MPNAERSPARAALTSASSAEVSVVGWAITARRSMLAVRKSRTYPKFYPKCHPGTINQSLPPEHPDAQSARCVNKAELAGTERVPAYSLPASNLREPAPGNVLDDNKMAGSCVQ